jgi:hypothetical protein
MTRPDYWLAKFSNLRVDRQFYPCNLYQIASSVVLPYGNTESMRFG